MREQEIQGREKGRRRRKEEEREREWIIMSKTRKSITQVCTCQCAGHKSTLTIFGIFNCVIVCAHGYVLVVRLHVCIHIHCAYILHPSQCIVGDEV